MKRIALLLLVSCFVLLQPGRPTSAQEQPKAPAAAKAVAKHRGRPAPHWEKLADGVEVLRLFGTDVGPQKPEIAVLKLSDEQHKVFLKDPMKFVEEHKIYPFKLRRVVRGRVPPIKAAAPAADPSGEWAVVLTHMPDCSAEYTDTGVVE